MSAGTSRKKKRGAVRKSDSKLIGGYVPAQLHQTVMDAVEALDTDISKFLRAALKEKLARDYRAEVTA